jgi:hypothetical protein
MRLLGIKPIVDPCHHVSIPRFLKNGFLSPHFADRYVAFVLNAAERYPWVKQYTPFNAC